KEDALKAAGGEQVVLWLMISDTAMEEELANWLRLLPQNSIIIDGGNSDYRLTKNRAETVKTQGSVYMDVGTSGGVWGYKNGFSMMAGGDEPAFKIIEPVLRALAEPSGSYGYFGPSGAGHFVKMVHNAIEYGMMESLVEGYRLLKEGPYQAIDLAKAGEVWQHGSVIVSWLNELSQSVLAKNPQLDNIDGVVAESGEARWALETARDQQVPMPSIQASFDVRLASQKGETNFATKLLAAMRNKFGGHDINPSSGS
ncbi:MAG TPA: NADP-dependent phosphogluconate dehydrogenase, partial [Candidatus Saccharimonadales bacterium]|nr:NADP-dependent phosphogluconate dehydrogenase [Candidatus Saccharimonadales bacterium]